MSQAFNNASFLGTELITDELIAAHAADLPDALARLERQLAHADEFFESAAFLSSYGDHAEAQVLLGYCRARLEQALATLDRLGIRVTKQPFGADV